MAQSLLQAIKAPPLWILLSSYLFIFNAWLMLPSKWIPISGVAATAALLVYLFGFCRNFFLNRWEQLGYLLVLLDILLEGILIKTHSMVGFYGCALGFAIVLVGYRQHLLEK